MTTHQTGGPTLVQTRGGIPKGRRRVAPKAADTSDVTRFRGILIATVLGAIAVMAAVFASAATGTSLVPTRSLSKPHRTAGVQCENCHKGTGPVGAEPDLGDACLGCHGAHPSTRSGHRAAAQNGALRCFDCHRTHEADAGVIFDPAGSVTRYGAGRSYAVDDVVTAFHSPDTATVPIVEASSCFRCHDGKAARDPIIQCLIAGQDALGDARPAVCFDEHREVLAPEGAERTAVWGAARKVAAAHPTVEATSTDDPTAPLGWVAIGLAAAFGGLGVHRLVRKVATKPAKAKVDPGQMLPSKVVRLPQINTNTCIGCHACVDACPYDVLEVRGYVAQVVRPDDCCGLTLCEQRCPNGSLVITDGDPIEDRPRMNQNMESLDTPGIYLAGDLTGLPLIRNAINQGAQVMKTVAQSLGGRSAGDQTFDVIIVGAGPAGISAALQAKQLGMNYVVLEQGSVAESIRSFPRGKLVFDQPLGMPRVGDLWLREATKEELLGKWLRVVHGEQLNIFEGLRVSAVQPVGAPPHGHFAVTYVDAAGAHQTLQGRRIILAFGRRGSPRKLGIEIPDSVANNVHYSLADARSFAGQKVLVVGLGDVAMETAIALANQPGTQVTVSYRKDDFTRGKTRNMEETKRLIAAQRIRMLWKTEVQGLAPGRVTLSSDGGPIEVDADFVFVMIGNIAPWKFLESCGVKRATVASATVYGGQAVAAAGPGAPMAPPAVGHPPQPPHGPS